MDDPLSVSIENTTMATTTTAATTSKTSTSSPIKILVHPFKGRCAEAARDIKRGDKVHQETAYSMVPDSEAKAQICSHCFTWLQDPKDADPGFKPIPCGGAGGADGADGAGCENVSYCSKACRDKDAILYHNSECSFLEKFLEEAKTTLALDSYTIDFTWMLIRAIHRSGNSDLDQLNDEESCATSYTSGSTASSFKHIWLMCSNSVCFSDEKILDFVKVSRVLVRYILHLEKEAKKSSSPPPPLLSATYSPSESESTLFTSRVAPILESNGYYTHVLTEYPFTTLSTISNLFCKAFTLICKEECNSFGIYNFSILGPTHPRQPYGLAVFPQSVFFNHSCSPNICYVTRGKEIIFFAVDDIQAGQELCISYVSLEDQILSSSNGNTNSSSSTDPATIKALAEKRRANLSSVFFFDCDCRRCAVELGKEANTGEVERHRKLMKMMLCGKCGCYGWFVPQPLSRAFLDGGNGIMSRTDSKKVDETPDLWICEACGREEGKVKA